MTNPLDALEALIKWSHIAPTCPDTLGSFPFEGKDPFVIDRLPSVIFAGNQDKFGHRYSSGRRVEARKTYCPPGILHTSSLPIVFYLPGFRAIIFD